MSGSPPTRAKLVKTIAGLHTSGALFYKYDKKKADFNSRTENQCNNWASKKENVEAFYCGEPPKGESCTPKKTYSYNFETMQPTRSPTPQG